jgi:hypothetical protein
MLRPHAITLVAALLFCAVTSSAQEEQSTPTAPTSGGYMPPALSLESLVATDKAISDAVTGYGRYGDTPSFRAAIQSAAASGDVGAQLFLGEQYIPEQCPMDPDHDVPGCSPNGKHNPKVIFRANLLDLPASYEDAIQWLARASAQGSGEASEILAQLITRMLSNSYPTSYTQADSAVLHALARSQGFDVEPLSVSCYQLTPAASERTEDLTFVVPPRRPLKAEAAPLEPFTNQELQIMQAAGATGTLHFEAETSGDESSLLSRPAGPSAHIRVILDHDPGQEIHLPIPAHHDVIYLQRGDRFFSLPADLPTLPRFISIMPQHAETKQVSVFVQQVSGDYSGTLCARF